LTTIIFHAKLSPVAERTGIRSAPATKSGAFRHRERAGHLAGGASVPTPSSLEDQIIRALRRITRAIDLRSRALMQQHGLTAPQLGALQAIGRLEPVLAGEVAREIHLGQPTVTGILNRLERQGLIGRARGQRDRRNVEVRLTDEGRRVLSSAPSLLETTFQRRLSELKEWQQTQILSTLQHLADLMDAGDLEERSELNLPLALDLPQSPAPEPTEESTETW
jgi:DNA-binding MarR family transcriptional regulator